MSSVAAATFLPSRTRHRAQRSAVFRSTRSTRPYSRSPTRWRPPASNSAPTSIGPSPAEADHIASFGLPIEDLDLTVRSYNCLKREGVHTVGELVGRTESDLLDIRNFGQKSIDEVKVKLHSLGLSLKDSPASFDPTTVPGYDATTGTWSDTDASTFTDGEGTEQDYAETEQL